MAFTAQLGYQVAQGLPCPTADTLQHEMAADLGSDPFAADATGTPIGRFDVVVSRPGPGFRAEVKFYDTAGVQQWSSAYTTKTATPGACNRVVTKDVLARITVEVTAPSFWSARSRSSAWHRQLLPPPAPAPPPPPPPALPSRLRLRSLCRPRRRTGGCTFAGRSALPASAASASGPSQRPEARCARASRSPPAGPEGLRFGLAVEGRTDGAATDAYGIRTQLFAGALVACGSKDLHEGSVVTVGFLGCLVFMGGDLRAANDEARGYQAHDVPFGALGARVALDLRLASWAALRPQIEILPTLKSAFAHLKQPVEHLGDVTGTAGVAAVFLF